MTEFSVWGGNDGILSFLRSAAPEVAWCNENSRAYALVVLPGAAAVPETAVHTAVIPSHLPVTAKQVITYGLGQASTLTLSSFREDGCMISLQRDIVTISGEKLLRQEIPLPPSDNPDLLLSLCGTLLAAGAAPEFNGFEFIGSC
ncbi:MAG: hypothetical protein FWH04_00505 [Oscillospiraceae bacterium]|nr:hypothetical protein [Oscillospiraceae bacterium]